MRKSYLSALFNSGLAVLGCLTLGHASAALGQGQCAKTHLHSKGSPEIDGGPAFLHRMNSTLHISQFVEHEARNVKQATGKTLVKPADKLAAWLNYLRQSYNSLSDNSVTLHRLKDYYHQKYVIKPHEIPDGYFELQVQIAHNQGRGNNAIDPVQRDYLARAAVEDQKKSLDHWLDYLLSRDSDTYPMWVKYWSFTGLVKLGKFDPETGTFAEGRKGLASPFPELNREAFAMVVDAIVKKVNKRSLDGISDPVLKSLLDGANFGKLYGRALYLVTHKRIEMSSTQGEWVTFKQGNDPTALVKTLEGMNTGWCTVGESTAREQLRGGDFHIYYSLNEQGQAKIPRLAIRMQGDSIAEVRGIAKHQNLDSKIAGTSILEKKLKEFGSEGEAYQKKNAQMTQLTLIEAKVKKNQDLSADDLLFLYQIKEQIVGFGFESDPRISQLINLRNIKQDISQILNISEDKVSLTKDEFLSGDSVYHYGNLEFPELKSIEGLKLPLYVNGNLNLSGLESVRGLVLPKTVNANLFLSPTVGRRLELNLLSFVFPPGMAPMLSQPVSDPARCTVGDGIFLGKFRIEGKSLLRSARPNSLEN